MNLIQFFPLIYQQKQVRQRQEEDYELQLHYQVTK